jgi:hypothetical protein
MRSKRDSYIRGVLALGVLGLVTASLLVGPATAHVTKKFPHLRKHLNNAEFLNGAVTISETDTVNGGFAIDSGDERTVSCPPGMQALSGGVTVPTGEVVDPVNFLDVTIMENGPVPASGAFATGWHAQVYNNGDDDEQWVVSVICAKPAK